MQTREQKASHRSMLFTRIAAAEREGDTWDQLFETVARDCPGDYQPKLLALVADIRAGKTPVAELMGRSGLFLPWELSLILLGIGVGQSRSVFQRLGQHYAMLARAWQVFRSQVVLPLVLLTLSSLLVFRKDAGEGAWAFLQYLGQALWLPLLLIALLYLSVRLVHRQRRDVNYRFLPDWLSRLPVMRSLAVSVSLYHYLMNLALCIRVGLPLRQTLSLGAKAESNIQMRDQYQRIALDVEAGKSLSQAFSDSHLLEQARLGHQTPAASQDKTADSAQLRIAGLVQGALEEQLMYLARWLPRSLYFLIPLTWLG